MPPDNDRHIPTAPATKDLGILTFHIILLSTPVLSINIALMISGIDILTAPKEILNKNVIKVINSRISIIEIL
jgi:hypothetical protein